MKDANKQQMERESVRSEAATETLAASLRLSIYRVVQSFEKADRLLVEPLGVTVSQAYALLSFPKESTISMGELSERLEVAGSTATRMVDQLARKGLVLRAPAEEDRRVWSVQLTPKGKEMRAHLEEKFRHFFFALAERFPAEERGDLVSSMEKVTAVLVEFVGTKMRDHEPASHENFYSAGEGIQ